MNYKVESLQDLSHKLLVISISSPLLLGVYRNDLLIRTFSSEKKTSDILLPLLRDILSEYDISEIIYTRGPGSYMAIKLTYIMLKTIEILKGIKCVGCSGFALNGGEPIKAIGNLYFIKEKETIMTKKFEQPVNVVFTLPQSIHDLEIDEESTPEYSLPAV
jgi:tRNA A37 threonylcarbamoyladenosine modification protein TsaB